MFVLVKSPRYVNLINNTEIIAGVFEPRYLVVFLTVLIKFVESEFIDIIQRTYIVCYHQRALVTHHIIVCKN